MIVDYKVFLEQTMNNPEDWDLCVAIEYKDHAAMDGLAAKAEMVRDKILGGKGAAQQLRENGPDPGDHQLGTARKSTWNSDNLMAWGGRPRRPPSVTFT